MPEFEVEGHRIMNALKRHHGVRRAIDILTGDF
jgi:hypothetical protein